MLTKQQLQEQWDKKPIQKSPTNNLKKHMNNNNNDYIDNNIIEEIDKINNNNNNNQHQNENQNINLKNQNDYQLLLTNYQLRMALMESRLNDMERRITTLKNEKKQTIVVKQNENEQQNNIRLFKYV